MYMCVMRITLIKGRGTFKRALGILKVYLKYAYRFDSVEIMLQGSKSWKGEKDRGSL